MKKLILALAATTLLASCSSDTTDSSKVSQDEIHQYYSVDFNEGSGTTRAYAEFRIGGGTGTTVRLQAPSVIRYNGRELERRNILGTHYVLNTDGPMSIDHNFEYTDSNGKTHLNSIQLAPVSVGAVVGTVARTAALIIPYRADNLSADDTIEAEITNFDRSVTVYASSRTPGTPISFVSAELSKLSAGQGTLVLKRTRRSALQSNAGKGGSLYGQYIVTKKIVIE